MTGLTSDKYYVFRLKARNSFGSPTAYGSQGYAVHTHTVPTAPLGFKVTTVRHVEKDTKLAQKLGQLQPSLAVFPQECMGQRASFGPT